MLKLSKSDITLGQTADDKFKAIQNIAGDLTAKGLVDSGYVEGMLNRENQNSTFLGNGIATVSYTHLTLPTINWV